MSTLFNSFEKQNKADWLAKIKKDLKGKAIEDLDWCLQEGIRFSPFAHSEDLPVKFPPIDNHKSNNSWEIGSVINVADFQSANKSTLSVLEKGATAI